MYLYVADDTSEGAVVQRKGRFKVTSADLSPKVQTHSLVIFISYVRFRKLVFALISCRLWCLELLKIMIELSRISITL